MTSAATPLVKPRHRALLDALKHRGRATVPDLAGDLDLNVETVRDHLRTLESEGLLRRDGTRPQGPGRPEILFALTPAAEVLFPRREGEVLKALTRYLVAHGQVRLLRAFLTEYVTHQGGGRARVAGLSGARRTREVVRILDEMGFMPVLEERGTSLRLCHCPLRDLVAATDLPCHEEIGFLKDLLGVPLKRVAHMPDGDSCCAYQVGKSA